MFKELLHRCSYESINESAKAILILGWITWSQQRYRKYKLGQIAFFTDIANSVYIIGEKYEVVITKQWIIMK